MKKLIFALICLFLTVPSQAGIITVDDDGPADFSNIQAAINASIDGDIIVVNPGTYTGPGNRDIDFFGKVITVRSIDPNDPNIVSTTIIDCKGSESELHRGFYFHNGEDTNSVLSGLTVINGVALSGGAMKFEDASPLVTNCVLMDNYAFGDYEEEHSGGAFICTNSSPVISGCIIRNNTARYQGNQVYCESGNALIKNCKFIGREVEVTGGSPVISGCVFLSTSIAIEITGHSKTYCIVENNIIKSSSMGIYLFRGMLGSIRNNVIVGTGDREGAGIYYRSHTSCPSINGNIITNWEHGIHHTYSSIEEERKAKITHNDLWNNWLNYISQRIPYDLTGLQGNISADPLFIVPDNNNFRLGYSSPCVDAGTDTGVYVDHAGNSRPLDGDNDGDSVSDIGAFELVPVTDAPVILARPAELTFIGREGQDDPADQVFLMRNGGAGALYWEIIEDCSWLEVLTPTGESSGQFNEVPVSVDITGLEIGSYTCQLLIYSDEAINSPETVTINLIVNGDLYVPDEYMTIQDAVDASNDGDRIIVADGTYTGTGNKDIDFYGKKITLKSENGPENCIINCKGRGRGFYFHFGETSQSKVQGFTITNAYAHDGGAVYCRGGSAEMSDCIIKNSSAFFGGGIYNLSDITVKNCFITGNYANNGGGIRGINMKLINCVFSNNRARAGGAIITIGGDNRIVNCNILGNEAYGYDSYGGGIIIAGNYLNHTYIKNCIVRDNIADIGDQIGLMAWNRDEVTLYASYNNIQDSLTGLYYASQPCTVYWQAGNIDAEPWFIEAGYWDKDGFWVEGDYHLLGDSPCIDAGDPNYVAEANEVDIDGEPRLWGERVDIGADELVLEAPYIHLSAKEFEFHAYQGGSNPESQFLSIRNLGPNTLCWEAVEDCSWLEVAPTSGESSGQINEVALRVDASGLGLGLYNCELTIMADEAVNSPQIVEVVLYVHVISRVPSQHETIQAAVDVAEDWTTIIVADGTYTGQGNRDINFFGKSITVKSANGPENCIINCNGSEVEPHRGFYFYSGEDEKSVLDGFTITNGYAYGDHFDRHGGGAIRCDYSSPVIRNCIILNNSAAWDGGGINNYNSNPTIINCTFIGNSAINNDGGGINNVNNSNPIITNCMFSNNLAYDWGGGIRNIHSSNPTIKNCIFSKNASDEGGGIFNYNNSNPNIVNCTFYGNFAPTGGGAIDSEEDSQTSIINSIVWGNVGPEMSGGGYNVSYSNIEGGWYGIGNLNTNPFFTNPNNEDFRLLLGSPCINAGDPYYIAEPDETDLDGKPRIIGGRIDMGAFEYSPPVPAETDIDPDTLNLRSMGKWITCYIWLPEDYNVADIDPDSVLLEYEIQPESLSLDEEQQVAIARFSRSDVQDILNVGEIELTIAVRLTDGTIFEATDIVRVIDKAGRN
jgi:parallel beta-helix repeat protein